MTTTTNATITSSSSIFVNVPAGTFTMGSEDGFAGEHPAHKVSVGAFQMMKFPVTQELYQAVMGSNPSHFNGPRQPVERVSWYDAVTFCNKLSELQGLTPHYRITETDEDPDVSCLGDTNGYRLPTKEEWEYAARGTDGRRFPWGNDEPRTELAQWRTNKTCDVDEHPLGVSPFGVEDMAGNVWEWCWSGFDSKAYQKKVGKISYRFIRGGSWSLDARRALRATNHYYGRPGGRYNYLGFRCVRYGG